MSAIGEPRSSLAPAETLDAIALLHALGVGSAKREEQKREINEEIDNAWIVSLGYAARVIIATEHRECREVKKQRKKRSWNALRLISSKL